MKVLAIETTDKTGSLAAGENGSSALVRALPPDQRSAQSLVPAISRFLDDLHWDIKDLDCIAVGIGPGSFTGLRVGAATAKILAWSLSAKIIGVNTLEALAIQVPGKPDNLLSCAVDAQRGDVAFQRFIFKKSGENTIPVPLDPVFQVCSLKKWLGIDIQDNVPLKDQEVNNTESASFIQTDLSYQKENSPSLEKTRFCGPILHKWEKNLPDHVKIRWTEKKYWDPSALGILNIALNRIALDQWDDMWTLLPVYSRLSAAEERLVNKVCIQKS
ncbi:MAG: tRNA (adenosine(37)-N6)-threonylcarbamoyltransferase complex dimerization subunit type 1 TsaB [Planctomycetia bacterium]|nr:tRNA (adenosine(37)-N6)-threonylcarbamoyltransferase complex dimerization subunit type 1 TsaB [Planctomycetia bacterium]